MNADTQQLRRQIKSRRRELSTDQVIEASQIISNALCQLRAIRRAQSIGIYLAGFGEVDCGVFAEQMRRRAKSIFAPILRKNQLVFAPLRSNATLRNNRYGIAEPHFKTRELRKPCELDVVITPLVVFDAQLNRLGMGGGYYDRSFAFRKRRRYWRRPLMIGVAYSFQRVEALLPQPWDVPLDVVITEKESYGSY